MERRLTDYKQGILKLLKGLGLFQLARYVTRKRLRILCYHGIWMDDRQPNPFNFLFMRSETFSRRMDLLDRLGYPVLPLEEALERLGDGSLPDSAVVITIDDGWYGTFRYMAPTLTARGFAATIYLTTYHAENGTPVFGVALQHILVTSPERVLDGDATRIESLNGRSHDLDNPVARDFVYDQVAAFAESRLNAHERVDLLADIASTLEYDWACAASSRQFGLMSLSEARECSKDGLLTFQLHTHRHRVRHNGASCAALEIADNRQRLLRISDAPTRHFCYPSGQWQSEDFAPLEAAGVRSATTTDNGLCSHKTHRLALPRVLDGERISDIEFEAELCGLMELRRTVIAALRGQPRTAKIS